MSWPEALELLSAEISEPVTFRVEAERQFLKRLTSAGVPPGEAELLITREWAILAGENDYTTGTFQRITGRRPRAVAELLHDYRAEFVCSPCAILTDVGDSPHSCFDQVRGQLRASSPLRCGGRSPVSGPGWALGRPAARYATVAKLKPSNKRSRDRDHDAGAARLRDGLASSRGADRADHRAGAA